MKIFILMMELIWGKVRIMLNIIYAGTPEFAVPALQALYRSDHRVVAVYTRPGRPAGRGRKIRQSPVWDFATSNHLPVFQPTQFQDREVRRLRTLDADLMVVVAYGLILPVAVLTAPDLGCINIHASLLPRWRGAAPVQRAILAGDHDSGVTIMQMDQGLDTGAMLMQQSLALDLRWSAGDVLHQLEAIGAKLLLSTIDRLLAKTLIPVAQNDALATYATRLEKREAAIDWRQSADNLARQIRAFAPWPVSFTALNGQSLRVWRADALDQSTTAAPGQVIAHNQQGIWVSCGTGVLQITELQFAGKTKNTAAQMLHGRNMSGQQFADILSL